MLVVNELKLKVRINNAGFLKGNEQKRFPLRSLRSQQQFKSHKISAKAQSVKLLVEEKGPQSQGG